MKRNAVALVLASLVLASQAYANETRAASFGKAKMFLADSSDWKSLPQTPKGSEIAFESVDGASWMSASVDLLGGTLAVNHGRDSDDASVSLLGNYWGSSMHWGSPVPTTGNNPNPSGAYGTQRVYDISDLLYATDLSDSLRLGLGLSWGVTTNQDYTYEEPSDANAKTVSKYSANIFGVSLGADFKDLGPIKLLQTGVRYQNYGQLNSEEEFSTGASILNKVTLDTTRMSIRVAGSLGEAGSISQFELSADQDTGSQKNQYQVAVPFLEGKEWYQQFTAGYAIGTSSEKGMFLLGAALQGWVSGYSEENNTPNTKFDWQQGYLSLVAMAAAEGNVNSWLELRGGVDANVMGGGGLTQNNTNSVTPASNYKYTFTYANQYGANLNIGTTLKFGNFSMDSAINADWLAYGPYLLSGSNNNDVWWASSITYALGE